MALVPRMLKSKSDSSVFEECHLMEDIVNIMTVQHLFSFNTFLFFFFFSIKQIKR